jgi:hypothetical protein
MNESKASPGPWTVSGPTGYLFQTGIKDANGTPVGCVYGDSDKDLSVKADARLIAAAPELLASLKAMVTIYVLPDNPTVLAAQAAIAKAEAQS